MCEYNDNTTTYLNSLCDLRHLLPFLIELSASAIKARRRRRLSEEIEKRYESTVNEEINEGIERSQR